MRLPSRSSLTIVAAVALMVVSPALAGCFSDDGEPSPTLAPAAGGNETMREVGANATGGLGAKETGVLVNGTGGRAHIHDYWGERQKVVVLDEVVRNDVYPIIPDRDANNGVFMKQLRLAEGQLIYEGAGKIEILVSQPTDAIQGVRMRYRAANMEDFSEAVPIQFDQPLEIALTPKMTDMPHSTTSLWQWDFYSDGTAKPLYGSFKVTITVYKARNIEFWPGHPDFYADKPYRVLMDNKAGETRHFGFEELFFSQNRGSMIKPDFLISMGTANVELFVNITQYSAPSEPTGYFVEFVNATRATIHRVSALEDSSGSFYHFSIPVHASAHDSPYADASRWQFRVLATFGGAGLCPGCFPYEVDYSMSAVAYPFAPDDPARPAEA